ncbi:hypothetical protein T265_08720 [Opisthorchis viverrini]|uniref:Uncharacterized protein n=1 Tax=Opisthorchis viverrini TaxID=6198 RepID=A0A074ZJ68_OPIVI|nr:hypothetical protein T265_08720 [Opisthorchis viverrini]KER23395.1 hypothetical protein T265_08720 [Opisthorchis viverrini]
MSRSPSSSRVGLAADAAGSSWNQKQWITALVTPWGASLFFRVCVDIRSASDQRDQLDVRGIFRMAVVMFMALAVGVLGDGCVHKQRGRF